MDRVEEVTSWEVGADWYDALVADEGHYYHQTVILPELLGAIRRHQGGVQRLLDLGCGQGILERVLPASVQYTGIDLSPSLLERASERARHPERAHWIQGDCCALPPLDSPPFDAVTVVLALQGMEFPDRCLRHAAEHLDEDGRMYVVLNHPAFRVPKASDWHWDRAARVMGRTVEAYMTPLQIPLSLRPSQGEESPQTWAFHLPLSTWSTLAQQAGMGIEQIYEWVSPKRSEGGRAQEEDRARREIPLFLCMVLRPWGRPS